MKKLITFVAVLALVFPLSAMAMTPITDVEMAEVTGQVGVDIAIVDMHMDMSIGNISWGDIDTTALAGTMWIAGNPTDYTGGYININDMVMTDIFITLAGVKSLVTTTGPVNAIYADPFKIDVATLGAATPGTQVFANLAGQTGIVMTMPDMHMQVGEISFGGIYLADQVYAYSNWAFNTLLDAFAGVNTASGALTEQLGVLNISAFDLRMYSSVDGYLATGLKAFPNNPSRVYILAH